MKAKPRKEARNTESIPDPGNNGTTRNCLKTRASRFRRTRKPGSRRLAAPEEEPDPRRPNCRFCSGFEKSSQFRSQSGCRKTRDPSSKWIPNAVATPPAATPYGREAPESWWKKTKQSVTFFPGPTPPYLDSRLRWNDGGRTANGVPTKFAALRGKHCNAQCPCSRFRLVRRWFS